MLSSDAKFLKGLVDSDARVQRLQRAQRHRVLQYELQADEADKEQESARQHRQRVLVREQALAEELHHRQQQDVRHDKLIQLARERAPELRELETRLLAAYTSKERLHQIEVQQQLKEKERDEERAYAQWALNDADQFNKEESAKRLAAVAKLQQQNAALAKQIAEREANQASAQKQFVQEKEEVDAVVAHLQEQDMLDKLDRMEKQRQLKAQHDEFTRQREAMKRSEEERRRKEEQDIKAFMASQTQRRETGEKLRKERETSKQKLLEQQSKQIAVETRRKEELEELINDLYTEQDAAKMRQAEQAEAERRRRDREIMVAANEEQKRLRAERREAEHAEEQQFRMMMMAKFAEDARMEQYNRQRRQQMKQEHLRKVNELLEEKRRLQAVDKAREMDLARLADVHEAEFQTFVQEERERLLGEHLTKLGGLVPKGVVLTEDEKTRFLPSVSTSPARA